MSQERTLIKEMLLERYSKARPRGRDMRKLPKPYECREVVFRCSNGWTIERLPREDYAIEGFFMGHCLGGVDSHGCNGPYLSLREPDGTPHVTISGSILYGRCNAYPKEEYVLLIKEFIPNPRKPSFTRWGEDNDTDYHKNGLLDDRDYRDMVYGASWRGKDWYSKRKESSV